QRPHHGLDLALTCLGTDIAPMGVPWGVWTEGAGGRSFESSFWSFMWFVGFCFLANQWQVTKHEDNPLREGGDAARAAITFSFFSIFTWAGQSFLGYQRYKLGADSALFSQDYTDPSQDAAGAPYTSFGGDDLESPGGGGGQANSDGAFDGTGGYQRQDY
ncbi:synaptogyrin-1-like, partial [Epinephelus moara]|uniref:synaptogyrin-1-like n=1 Tax=Epinephelus moara TaxID=300413 RepID=UPI00214F11E7